MNYNFIDLKGQRFSRLRVIEWVGNNKSDRRAAWLCLCDCGNECVVIGRKLRVGKAKSCGCLRHAKVLDGVGSETRIYSIWKGMRDRCLNPKCKDFKHYGGRGIAICEQWLQVEQFRDWALTHGYADNLTIDRIDNDGGYNPENCEWVTLSENSAKRHRPRTLQLNQ